MPVSESAPQTPDLNAKPPSWTAAKVLRLFEMPFNDLLYQAHTAHRRHFDPNEVQLSALLSIKTGGCPEDCGYCPQSAHHGTEVEAGKLMCTEDIVVAASEAKATGATRFCMARHGGAPATGTWPMSLRRWRR